MPDFSEAVWALHSILADPKSTPSAARAAKQRLLRILAGFGDSLALGSVVSVIRLPRPEAAGGCRRSHRRPCRFASVGAVEGGLRWNHRIGEP